MTTASLTAAQLINGSTVRIGGRTFEHKGLLSDCGLRYDACSKTWAGVLSAWTVTPQGKAESFDLARLRNLVASGDLRIVGEAAPQQPATRWAHGPVGCRELDWNC